MTLLPLYSGPVTRIGPPTYREMADTLHHHVDALDEVILPGLPAWDQDSARELKELKQLAATLTPDTSIEVKREMRTALWELRQALENGASKSLRIPHPADDLTVRRAIEKVRTAALDNSWEGHQRYPREMTVIRPSTADVPNYRLIGPGLSRGGQVTEDGRDWLIGQGFRRFVDLRGDDGDNPHFQWVIPAWPGVERIHIRVEDWEVPTLEEVYQFIKLANEAKDIPTYFHCKAGIGRTGTMAACWRITRGWSADEAVEAERFHSYDATFKQEQFVRDFEKLYRADKARIDARIT